MRRSCFLQDGRETHEAFRCRGVIYRAKRSTLWTGWIRWTKTIHRKGAPNLYPTTTRRFSTLFLALLSHTILNTAKNPVVAEAAQSLIQGRAPGFRNTPPARFDATPVGARFIAPKGLPYGPDRQDRPDERETHKIFRCRLNRSRRERKYQWVFKTILVPLRVDRASRDIIFERI